MNKINKRKIVLVNGNIFIINALYTNKNRRLENMPLF